MAVPATGAAIMQQNAELLTVMRTDLQQKAAAAKSAAVERTPQQMLEEMTAERDALQSQLAAATRAQKMRESLATASPDLENELLKAENEQLTSTATRLKIVASALFATLVAVSISSYAYFQSCVCKDRTPNN